MHQVYLLLVLAVLRLLDHNLDRSLLAHEWRELRLVEHLVLMLHFDWVDREGGMLGWVEAHKLGLHGLHVEELAFHVGCTVHRLHVLTACSKLLLGLQLGHLPVLIDDSVRVHDRWNLAWHPDTRGCHLGRHLAPLGSTGWWHLHAAHLRLILGRGLTANVTVAVSEGTTVLVRALAAAFKIFANVALVVDWVDSEWLLVHLATLRYLLIHLGWEHALAWERTILLAHI